MERGARTLNAPIISRLWLNERGGLRRELAQSSALTLAAAEAEHAVWLLDEAIAELHDAPVIRLDFGRVGDVPRAAASMARQAILLDADDPDAFNTGEWARSQDQTITLLHARRRFGDLVDSAFDTTQSIEPAAVVNTAVAALSAAALERNTSGLLILIGAERWLVDKDLTQFLWQVRSSAQALAAPSSVRVVFCGGPFVSTARESAKSPFLGWGSEIDLGFPHRGQLSAALADRLATVYPTTDAERTAAAIVERADGCLSAAEDLCDLIVGHALDRDPVDLPRAWDELLARRAPRLRAQASAVAGLHTLALALLHAIAHGSAPYAAGFPGTVTRALNELKAAGVIAYQGPRRYRLVDPLLAAWLTSA